MDDATRQDYLTLLSWTGETTSGLGALIRDCGSPAAALDAGEEQLAELPAGTQKVLHRARRSWPHPQRNRYGNASDLVAQASLSEFVFLPVTHQDYPAALRDTPDPPPWLFCRGRPELLARPSVAIVGSRRASHAGLKAARRIGRTLAQAGYNVCSGLALGVDAAAHAGALETGYTVAVLASGIDRVSPVRHQGLAARIEDRGCLLSELPLGTAPQRHQFPRRNRIISGLCTATVIVEAALPSGTLHTAAAALEQGRDVFVLPWSVFHSQGAGCLQLLRDGAVPICSLDELGNYFPDAASKEDKSEYLLCSQAYQSLLDLIGDQPISVNTLAQSQAKSIAELLMLLGEMEAKGWIRRSGGLYERA